MAKKIGSATTEYIYFNGDVLAEYSLGDQLWSDYIFAGGRRLAAAGTDDILNPGFEQGLEGWTTGASDGSGSEQVITDSTRAHSGSNYLQLATTTAQVTADNEVVAVNPVDHLTFGGWVYLEPGSATGGYVGWNLSVLDANGNALGFPGATNVTSGAWTYQSVNYTVPSGGASVRLYGQIYQPTGATTARFDDGFLTGAGGLGVHYYHGDHLGSSRLMTDSAGNQSWSATYLPFGQEWNPQATANHYKFTGDERDSETSLDHTWFRQYSSQLGRWMHPDPAGLAAVNPSNPQSWDRYSYIMNDPINYVDPLGLGNCKPHDSRSSCHGIACLNPAAGCVGTPGFCGISGYCDNNNPGDPNASSCSLDGASISCGTVQGLVNSGGGYFNFGPDWYFRGDTAYGTNCYAAVFDAAFCLGDLSALAADGGNSSWAWTFTKEFFGNFSLKGARQPGESWSACVDRSQSALLGQTGTAVLNSLTVIGPVATAYTTPVIRTTEISGVSVIRSAWEADLAANARAGTGLANFATKASRPLSKGLAIVTAVALGVKGGFYTACAH